MFVDGLVARLMLNDGLVARFMLVDGLVAGLVAGLMAICDPPSRNQSD